MPDHSGHWQDESRHVRNLRREAKRPWVWVVFAILTVTNLGVGSGLVSAFWEADAVRPLKETFWPGGDQIEAGMIIATGERREDLVLIPQHALISGGPGAWATNSFERAYCIEAKPEVLARLRRELAKSGNRAIWGSFGGAAYGQWTSCGGRSRRGRFYLYELIKTQPITGCQPDAFDPKALRCRPPALKPEPARMIERVVTVSVKAVVTPDNKMLDCGLGEPSGEAGVNARVCSDLARDEGFLPVQSSKGKPPPGTRLVERIYEYRVTRPEPGSGMAGN